MADTPVSQGRQKAERTGRLAERLVAWRYRLMGYAILVQRFKCRGGEIDLVARKQSRGETLLAFIEVKARRRADDAVFAVTDRARRRIESAGRQFIAQRPDFAAVPIGFVTCRMQPILDLHSKLAHCSLLLSPTYYLLSLLARKIIFPKRPNQKVFEYLNKRTGRFKFLDQFSICSDRKEDPKLRIVPHQNLGRLNAEPRRTG